MENKKEPTYTINKIIKQPIYFYFDETTGAKVYDVEFMLQDFQDKLNQLTKGTKWNQP
jgi:hypothetical protein